eukprot:3939106-Rhodomonas_salina.1
MSHSTSLPPSPPAAFYLLTLLFATPSPSLPKPAPLLPPPSCPRNLLPPLPLPMFFLPVLPSLPSLSRLSLSLFLSSFHSGNEGRGQGKGKRGGVPSADGRTNAGLPMSADRLCRVSGLELTDAMTLQGSTQPP